MIFQGAAAPCGAIGVADTRLPPLRGCAPQRPPRPPWRGLGQSPRKNLSCASKLVSGDFTGDGAIKGLYALFGAHVHVFLKQFCG